MPVRSDADGGDPDGDAVPPVRAAESTSDCGCVWVRTEEYGDVISRPCDAHRAKVELRAELDRRMEHYAVRAMDIELDSVVRAKRTVACQPPPWRVVELLTAGTVLGDPDDAVPDPPD